jgi:hypothetical protein
MGNNYTLTREFLQNFAIFEESYFNLRSTLMEALREGENPDLPEGMCLLPPAPACPLMLRHSLRVAYA